jgi:hypothetical protein
LKGAFFLHEESGRNLSLF